MKMGCLLTEKGMGVFTGKTRFWIFCERCEVSIRRCSVPDLHKFFEFDESLFPAEFGIKCFSCDAILKSGQELFSNTDNLFDSSLLVNP